VPKLSCRELGGDCDYIAKGETVEDVKRDLLAHVAETHGRRLANMSNDEREAFDIRIDQVLRHR